ncbi:MAG: hypothetical protein Q9159_002751 [Coniocarpon cinnabarinum]
MSGGVCGRTVPVIIVRLVYLVPSLRSYNASSKLYAAVLASEVHVRVAMGLTCLPFIKAVLDAMQHGYITGEVYARRPRATGTRDPDYTFKGSGPWNRLKELSRVKSRDDGSLHHLRRGESQSHEVGIQATACADGRFESESGNHQNSHVGIATTVTTEIERA